MDVCRVRAAPGTRDARDLCFELLARWQGGSPYAFFEALNAHPEPFELLSAWRSRLELEALKLPKQARIFLNLTPRELLEDPSLRQGALFSKLAGRDVVVEILEKMSPSELVLADQTLLQLWNQGLELAVDDALGGPRDGLVARGVYADWIKLALPLVRQLPHSNHAFRLVQALVRDARLNGARVIAEGVETAEELAAARAAGVRFVQGFLLGRPTRIASFPSEFSRVLRAEHVDDAGFRLLAESNRLRRDAAARSVAAWRSFQPDSQQDLKRAMFLRRASSCRFILLMLACCGVLLLAKTGGVVAGEGAVAAFTPRPATGPISNSVAGEGAVAAFTPSAIGDVSNIATEGDLGLEVSQSRGEEALNGQDKGSAPSLYPELLTEALLPLLETAGSSKNLESHLESHLESLNRAAYVAQLLAPHLEPSTPTALDVARLRIRISLQLTQAGGAYSWLPKDGQVTVYTVEYDLSSLDGPRAREELAKAWERAEAEAAGIEGSSFIAPVAFVPSMEILLQRALEMALSANVVHAVLVIVPMKTGAIKIRRVEVSDIRQGRGLG